MKLLNKLLGLFRKKKQVELTQEQQADLFYWASHTWPELMEKPPEIQEWVWFFGKDKEPTRGCVTDYRINKGRSGYVLRYGPRESQGKWIPATEPVFYNKEELLLYGIGAQWKEIARLLKNLKQSEDNAYLIQEYTVRRVAECKKFIARFQQLLEEGSKQNGSGV